MSENISSSSASTSRRSFLGLMGVAGAVAVASPLLAACGSDGASSSSGGRKRYRIVQPSKDPLVVWAVSYLAEDRGYYKAEGLDVERVLLLGGPAALTGLLSGAGDALISTPGETLSAVAKRQKLQVVMGHTNNMPSTFVISKAVAGRLEITADSPLADRQAALGRIDKARFGITAPGSQTDAFTRMALKQAGGSAEDARIVPLQTASNCLAALGKGDIDGYIGVPPAGEQAVSQSGAVVLLTAQAGEIKGAEALQGMSLVVKRAQLKSDPDLYAAAIRAEVKAMKELNDDPEGMGALLRKTRFAQLDEKVWDTTWSRLAPSFQSPKVTSASLGAWLSNGLVDAGKVTTDDVDLDAVIDMSLTDKAISAASWSTASA
jgi:NitT/TauT family transport system substrate-binding protein